jgi:hypothetical protein
MKKQGLTDRETTIGECDTTAAIVERVGFEFIAMPVPDKT